MRLIHSLLAIIFFSFSSFTFGTDTVAKAFKLNDSGQYAQSIEMLDRLITANEPNAAYAAALVHLNHKNPVAALDYLYLADARGDLRATYTLAEVLLSGEVGSANAEAFRLAKKAANGGYRKAQLGVANYYLYEKEPDDPITLAEALTWAQAAYAETDVASAYTLAALLYQNGDYSESHSLFLSVAEFGEPQAQFHVAKNFMTGTGTDKNESLAEKWMLTAASAGVKEAFIYAYAFLAKTNQAKARQYLEMAMANDEAGAYYADYLDNLQGFTGPKNTSRAIESLQKAAFLGMQEAIRSLATRYQNGDGVPKSNTKALFWLWKLDPDKYPMKDWEISAVEGQIAAIAKLDDFEPSDVLKPYLVSISTSFYTSQVREDSAQYLNEYVIPNMASTIDTSLSGERYRISRDGESIRGSSGTTYRITGESIRGSDGTWGRRVGRSTFFSDGLSSRSSRDGRSIRFSDGTSARISQDGKRARFSDGTSCRSVGRSTWCN